MLYREIIAVCSQIHTKHINTLCGQNVGFLNIKTGGTYNDHWVLNVSRAVSVALALYKATSVSSWAANSCLSDPEIIHQPSLW